jgi:hypothetical protein
MATFFDQVQPMLGEFAEFDFCLKQAASMNNHG